MNVQGTRYIVLCQLRLADVFIATLPLRLSMLGEELFINHVGAVSSNICTCFNRELYLVPILQTLFVACSVSVLHVFLIVVATYALLLWLSLQFSPHFDVFVETISPFLPSMQEFCCMQHWYWACIQCASGFTMLPMSILWL